MTGYAAHEFCQNDTSFVWEVRTLNHRFCDINVTLPKSLRQFEIDIRKYIKKVVARGKVDVTLQLVENQDKPLNLSLNKPLLTALAGVFNDAKKEFQELTVNFDSIVNYPGLVTMHDNLSDDLESTLLLSLQEALERLSATRCQEGLGLQQYLLDRLQELQKLHASIVSARDVWMKKQAEDLQNKIQKILPEYDEKRFAEELFYYAEKSDIAEEVHRLQEHIASLQSLLDTGGVIGRRLDFLMQELLRETNTIGSKMSVSPIAKNILDMKVIIEQMREQSQNIE